MEVTGLKQFLGGADNSTALEIIKGERLRFNIEIVDEQDNAINLTGAELSATAEFYRVTISTTQNNTNITNLAKELQTGGTPVATKSLSIVATSSQRISGSLTLIIPDDLADGLTLAPAGANTNVLTAIVWVSYDLGSNEGKYIQRIVIIIRYAP